jgi:Zn-finger nucleic acid-binding protein
MEKTRLGEKQELQLDHCPRCGGIWFDYGEVQKLRESREEELWQRVPQRSELHRAQCHHCQAHIDRDATRCDACGKKITFDCPQCARPMQHVRHGELTLDVCRNCRGVWFDHHELAAIWKMELNTAIAKRRGGRMKHRADGSLVLLDALTYTPELVIYGAYGAGHVIAGAAQGLSHAPEVVGAAAEVVGEAASSVFETILEIIGGIFS